MSGFGQPLILRVDPALRLGTDFVGCRKRAPPNEPLYCKTGLRNTADQHDTELAKSAFAFGGLIAQPHTSERVVLAHRGFEPETFENKKALAGPT